MLLEVAWTLDFTNRLAARIARDRKKAPGGRPEQGVRTPRWRMGAQRATIGLIWFRKGCDAWPGSGHRTTRRISADRDPRPYAAPGPSDADVSHDALDYNPAVEPRRSGAWLNLLEESEKAFEDWNHHCDLIDERYASLSRLCDETRTQRVSVVLGELRGAQAGDLRHRAGAGCRHQI